MECNYVSDQCVETPLSNTRLVDFAFAVF